MDFVRVAWNDNEIKIPREYFESADFSPVLQCYIWEKTNILAEHQVLLRHPEDTKSVEPSDYPSLKHTDRIYLKCSLEKSETSFNLEAKKCNQPGKNENDEDTSDRNPLLNSSSNLQQLRDVEPQEKQKPQMKMRDAVLFGSSLMIMMFAIAALRVHLYEVGPMREGHFIREALKYIVKDTDTPPITAPAIHWTFRERFYHTAVDAGLVYTIIICFVCAVGALIREDLAKCKRVKWE